MTERIAGRLMMLIALPALLTVGVFAAPSCSHVNTPTGFISCMTNEADERDAMELINAALDRDDFMKHIDALVNLGGDAVKCLLRRAATAKGAGPTENRAKRAAEYLNARKLSSLPQRGGVAPRRVHNPEVTGSNPVAATDRSGFTDLYLGSAPTRVVDSGATLAGSIVFHDCDKHPDASICDVHWVLSIETRSPAAEGPWLPSTAERCPLAIPADVSTAFAGRGERRCVSWYPQPFNYMTDGGRWFPDPALFPGASGIVAPLWDEEAARAAEIRNALYRDGMVYGSRGGVVGLYAI